MRRTAIVLAGALCLGFIPPPPDRHLLNDVRVLSADDMQGRLIGSPGNAKARAYLLRRLKATGAKPVGRSYAHPFSAQAKNGERREGVNLLARIEGRSASDRILLISAHYDHLGVRDGKIYNGADDNASGVAVLLSMAEQFKRHPPEHTVILALWDGEEGGLMGARAFVKSPPVPLAKIALNMNMDMVSRGDKEELFVAGASHYPFLKARFERISATAPVKLKLGHDGPPWTGSDDWTTGSDHAAFHEAKIPFAYFGVEDHPDYHQPTDDADKIPVEWFRRSSVTLMQAARLLDRELDAIAQESGR